jgi:hypothetical protein
MFPGLLWEKVDTTALNDELVLISTLSYVHEGVRYLSVVNTEGEVAFGYFCFESMTCRSNTDNDNANTKSSGFCQAECHLP